jgi:integrase
MARLFKREQRDGSAGAIWWGDYKDGEGKRCRVSLETTDKDEAQRKLDDLKGRVARGEVFSTRATYAELRDDLLAEYTLGRRNLKEAKCRIAHLDRHFGTAKAAEITAGAITRYIAVRLTEVRDTPHKGLQKTPTTSTVNREVAVLLAMLALGYERGRVAKVPVVRKPEENGPRQGFVEVEQFQAIRSFLPADVACITTMLFEGCGRLREVTHLLRSQVDLETGRIHLKAEDTKTKQARTWYLRPTTLDMVRAHVERVRALEHALGRVLPMLFPIMPAPHVSPTLVGTQRDNIENVWRTACGAAGYPGVRVHDLRRSGIRALVRAGVREGVVMRISGHKSRQTFDRYNVTSETDLQDATAALDQALRDTTKTQQGALGSVRALPKRTATSS